MIDGLYPNLEEVQGLRSGRVAVGPRFLNGYSDRMPDGRAAHVAVGPRFLNGYSIVLEARIDAGVAVGPRFLNGYSRRRGA